MGTFDISLSTNNDKIRYSKLHVEMICCLCRCMEIIRWDKLKVRNQSGRTKEGSRPYNDLVYLG